jgi:hypothetical protein
MPEITPVEERQRAIGDTEVDDRRDGEILYENYERGPDVPSRLMRRFWGFPAGLMTLPIVTAKATVSSSTLMLARSSFPAPVSVPCR